MTPDARPLRIMLLTDVFPPKSGGSGWSTYYLGRALSERGHEVSAVRPVFDAPVARVGVRVVEWGGMPVTEVLLPPAANWTRRLGLQGAYRERTGVAALTRFAASRAAKGAVDVLHGGHAVSGLAAVAACLRSRSRGCEVASVVTVRDYWPLCPSSTRLVGSGSHDGECPDCHRLHSYLACSLSGSSLLKLPVRVAVATARWWNTRRAASLLARSDGIIAVSTYVRDELARSGRFPGSKLFAIPNLVHLPSVSAAVRDTALPAEISTDEPFLLFAGKLDTNKGADLLPSLVAEAGAVLPVIIAGDGPLRKQIGEEAARRGLDFRFLEWADNNTVIALMHRASALLFPSAWQEPLSRVLLEASAAGAAIVALDTGGTSDVILHGVSGWLARSPVEFVEGIRRVTGDSALNLRLRDGARLRAENCFAASVVSERVGHLYYDLLAKGGAD